MPVTALSNTDSILALLAQDTRSNPSNPGTRDRASTSTFGDLFAALSLRAAEFQMQALGSLLSGAFGKGNADGQASFSALLAPNNDLPEPQNSIADSSMPGGLAPTGRNTTLFDAESAYGMMSLINSQDLAYKAQLSELSQMKSYLAELRIDGQALGAISMATENQRIESGLQEFALHYNDWVRRFDGDMQIGGALNGVQAAQVSRYELEQSIGNMFNGATDGLHGLRDLGLSIDPGTRLAAIDIDRLDSVLAGNKQGAINTLRDFSMNFAKSAELLNADGNFIRKQIDNLSRVIHYIDDTTPALQAEFGVGKAARPSAQIARALAAYNAVYEV